MWKDFFSFSKRERLALIVLTVLVLVLQLALWTSDRWVGWLPDFLQKKYAERSLSRTELEEAFRDGQRPDSSRVYAGEKSSGSNDWPTVRPELFDPNCADSATLLRIGLKPYVVRNILKYRRKGGGFRKAADFSRIYGLDPQRYAELEPYIRIGGSERIGETERNGGTQSGTVSLAGRVVAESQTGKLSSEPASAAQENPPKPEGNQNQQVLNPAHENFIREVNAEPLVELNASDTTLLRQFRGVGSFTAARIVRYRKQLGGFYNISQLDEIQGLYPETLARLKLLFRVDPSGIVPIEVNKVSLERLRAHPYLNFYQAKTLVELRKSRGTIRSLRDLEGFPEFRPADLDRLRWYLKF